MTRAIKYQNKKLGRPRKGVGYTNDPERVIVAKYKGYCSDCSKDIEPGEWILWTPGGRLRHQSHKK